MGPLPSDSEAVGYPLKSPTFLPKRGDASVLSGIDLGVRMRMFEEELTPVVPANNIQSLINLGVGREEEIILLRQAR